MVVGKSRLASMNRKRNDLIKEICEVFLAPCGLWLSSLVMKHAGWIYRGSQISNFLFSNYCSATWGFFGGGKAYNNISRWLHLKLWIQSLPRDLSGFVQLVSAYIHGLLWADSLCYPKNVRNHFASRRDSVNRWVGILARALFLPVYNFRTQKEITVAFLILRPLSGTVSIPQMQIEYLQLVHGLW